MSKNESGEIICDDCGGWHVEWMHRCNKHGLDYCKGCECPECREDARYEDEH